MKGWSLRAAVLAAAILTLFVLLPAGAQAAPGDLDPSFGTGGVTYTNFGAEDYARDAATDSSGRVVVVGRSEHNNQTESDAIIARYTAAGALDSSFGGGDGVVQLHFGIGSFDSLAAVAIDDSGRIVVAGRTESDISCTSYCHGAIARFTSSGQLDPTFGGGDGIVTVGENHSGTTSVAIDGSGRILVGSGSAVYRFTETGALDPTFGNSGMAPIIGAYAGLVIDSAGRIVVAEYFGVERLLSTGQPDPAFGEDGLAHIDIAPGSSDFAYSVATDASNRVVVGGVTFLSGSAIDGQPFILRFTPAGALDPSFSGDGLVLGSDEGLITDLIVDQAGRYLAVGYSDELSPTSDILIRYLPDGSLDPAFGGGFGFTLVPFFANEVTTDSDQRIVVTGTGGEEGGDEIDFAVARYFGDITPSPPAPGPTTAPASATPPSGSEPLPGVSPGCQEARAHVAILNRRVRHATSRRQRKRLRAKLRQARSMAERLC